MMSFRRVALLVATIFALATGASAQTRDVPYWASLRFDEVRMRVGPSEEYRIDWLYKRKGLPVKVIRVVESWRLVRDPEGTQGWIAQSQLDPQRTAVVVGEGVAAIRDGAADNANLKWNAKPGVIGKLGDCDAGWCEFDIAGRRGWIRQNRLWGAGEP